MPGVDILCVFPLSGVTARGLNAPAEAMYTDIGRVGEEFIKSSASLTVLAAVLTTLVFRTYPRCRNFPFSSIRSALFIAPMMDFQHLHLLSSPRWKDKYGRLCHIKHLEDDMVPEVDVAQEIYMYLCENRKSRHKVYVVAVESGAFMVARLLEFIKIYGLNDELGLVDFPRLWCTLIANRGFEYPPSPPVTIWTLINLRPIHKGTTIKLA
ncbi:hypothetical protein CVT26_002394 [Gymnopilus dilepis]|uniref:Uncharacterized protein n=1 Tax=Gymnopilus dilepis TaxID=231916 RepID=A0A409YNB3_9AGAR|nr:hypothetical protein CVT26_002394 [Gymnopilus dilepis]